MTRQSGESMPAVHARAFRPQPILHGRERDQAIDTMSKRIVATYLAATPQQRKEGERFYSREAHGAARSIAAGVDPDSPHGRFLRSFPSPGEWQTEVPQGPNERLPETVQRKEFEEHVRRAAGAIARLSPQTDWDRNVRQAHEVAQLSDKDAARLARGDRSVLAGKELNRQTNANILKAHAILHGHETPEHNIPGGNKRVKIGSFYQNVAEPDTSPHTTIDYRAHDVSAGRLLRTSTERGLGSKGRYDMFEEAHNRAAELLNQHYPGLRIQKAELQPKQVQAVTWLADRDYQDKRLGGSRSGGHLHAGAGGRPLSRADLGVPVGQEHLNDMQFGPPS